MCAEELGRELRRKFRLDYEKELIIISKVCMQRLDRVWKLNDIPV